MGIRVGPKDVDAPQRRDGRQPWFVPPRLVTTHEIGERHATWLELFFDLVFVVAVTQLSHELVLDHSARGFLIFAALFVPVWVAWQGYTFYATRFDTDDLAFRGVYFAAMLAIAAMAVLVGDVAHGAHTAGFAVSYVCLRSLMLGLYWRAWRAVPEARALIGMYGSGYVLGVAIWVASLAVAPPARYVVWGIALVVELSLPPLSTRIHRLGAAASAALLGGIVVFLLSLVATRSVTASGPRRLGVSIKLGAVSSILVLLALQSALRPLVLAAALAIVLGAAVYAERMLIPARA